MKCSAVFEGNRVVIRYKGFVVVLDFTHVDPYAEPAGTSIAGCSVIIYPQNKPQS